MLKTTSLFKKIVLAALVAALTLAVLPLANVHASGLSDPTTPPADTTRLSDARLERVWARLQRTYERQGHILDRAGNMVERFQDLIDRLEINGKDVTALQAALNAFKDALKNAYPIYESAKGIVTSHQGFDADGKVTDQEKAVKTVKELGDKLPEIRQLVGGPGKALREAVQAFREANKPLN